MQKIKVPPKERGHKQLGRSKAIWHLVQLQAFFIVGTLSTLETPVNVWHARVLLANYGVAYTLEVSGSLMCGGVREGNTVKIIENRSGQECSGRNFPRFSYHCRHFERLLAQDPCFNTSQIHVHMTDIACILYYMSQFPRRSEYHGSFHDLHEFEK